MTTLSDRIGGRFGRHCMAEYSYSRKIDVDFNFIDDTPGFWDGFWDGDGVGRSEHDPCVESAELRRFSRLLWSKEKCYGDIVIRETYGGHLVYRNTEIACDTIVTRFIDRKNAAILSDFAKEIPDYRRKTEDLVKASYTMGGQIIFPSGTNGVFDRRWNDKTIRGRWDRTLECIRRFYSGEDSPLSSALQEDGWFFRMFRDFKGYVEYFFLQDYVSEDMTSVKTLYGDEGFGKDCMPSTAEEYERWISVNTELMKKRNARISEYVDINTKLPFSMGNLIGRNVARTDLHTINEMPDDNVRLILSRTIGPRDIAIFERGHCPTCMEDKWFFYTENGKTYFHRSWTGNCIYILDIALGTKHELIVNRDSKQYTVTDDGECIRMFNTLVNSYLSDLDFDRV